MTDYGALMGFVQRFRMVTASTICSLIAMATLVLIGSLSDTRRILALTQRLTVITSSYGERFLFMKLLARFYSALLLTEYGFRWVSSAGTCSWKPVTASESQKANR